MSNPCLYVFVNTDLASMNMGKAMAQASHAANAFMDKWYYNNTYDNGWFNLVEAWRESTTQGFGTQLCMRADDFGEAWGELQGMAVSDSVIDPTYPFEVNHEIFALLDKSRIVDFSVRSDKVVCTRKEMTAFYVFGDRDDPEFRATMKKYKLHP